MPPTEVDVFDHAVHTADAWLAEVARHLGTDHRHTAYRTLRAWLHTLRDRLPVNSAADFAAQLPELFRGAFYDGWQPHRMPDKYGPDEYRQRFAHEAQIPLAQVDTAAPAVTAALRARLAPGQIDQVLQLLTQPVRRILQGPAAAPATPPPPPPPLPEVRQVQVPPGAGPDTPTDLEVRLAYLEEQLTTVAEAVRLLARGLEQLPTDGHNAERASRAGSRAHELLIAASPFPGSGPGGQPED